MTYFSRFAGACAAVLFAMPGMAFELQHTAGSVKTSSAPQRIVSYDLAVLDSLHALGVSVVGVPKINYVGDLAALESLPKIGTLFEPDYEVLQELKPDLIFAGGRSQRAIPTLKEFATTATFTNAPRNYLQDFQQNTLALAAAFDKTEQAELALQKINTNVAALQKANAGKTGAFVFMNKGNVMPHVLGDRFGYVFEMTGLESVLPAKDPQATTTRPEPGSPEAKAATALRAKQLTALVQADPDWLFVFDKEAISTGESTAAQTLAQHKELNKTTAFKSGRVIYVDPVRWYLVGAGLNNLQVVTDDLLKEMQ